MPSQTPRPFSLRWAEFSAPRGDRERWFPSDDQKETKPNDNTTLATTNDCILLYTLQKTELSSDRRSHKRYWNKRSRENVSIGDAKIESVLTCTWGIERRLCSFIYHAIGQPLRKVSKSSVSATNYPLLFRYYARALLWIHPIVLRPSAQTRDRIAVGQSIVMRMPSSSLWVEFLS